jgi:cobalt-zinc-cadmium efflux system protein
MAIGLIKRTSKILMQAAPEGLDLDQLKTEAENIEGVCELHHIHVWELDEHHRSPESHIVISDESILQQDKIKSEIKALLKERFQIGHSTLEFETQSKACSEGNNSFIPAH